jgi:flagellar biosynthesis/type III secretory pathway M-ring protein FliF/YscJ
MGMSAAEPFLPRKVIRPLGWLGLFVTAFVLCVFLFFRTFWHYEIELTTLRDASGSALLQKLDVLDVDYRIDSDGRVKVSSRDEVRLSEAGLLPHITNTLSSSFIQVVLLLLLSLLAVLIVIKGRTVFTILKAGAASATREQVQESLPEAKTVLASKSAKQRKVPAVEWRELLEEEHPQSVALYLLGLEADEAAEALEALPEAMRDAVWERMAFSRACDPALEQSLQSLFEYKREMRKRRQRPEERTEKMVSIYRLLCAETRQAFLSALRNVDPNDPLIAFLLKAPKARGPAAKANSALA